MNNIKSYYEKNKDDIKKKVIERRKKDLLKYKKYQHEYYLRNKKLKYNFDKVDDNIDETFSICDFNK